MISKMQLALTESKGKEESNHEELRRLRREARDAAARSDAMERQHIAEVAELKKVSFPEGDCIEV
jgi:hypothetical protein